MLSRKAKAIIVLVGAAIGATLGFVYSTKHGGDYSEVALGALAGAFVVNFILDIAA